MSSDSEDESMAMFREAMDTQFLNDNMYKEKGPKNGEPKIEKPPSLRRNQQEEDDSFNFFKVTPEFQAYVSKHLSERIETQLKELIVDGAVAGAKSKKRRVKGGVKLFRDSTGYLEVKEGNHEETEVVPKKIVVRDCSKEREERYVEAAVDPDVVLSGKEVRHWKSRRRSSLYVYKKGMDGVCTEENVIRDFF